MQFVYPAKIEDDGSGNLLVTFRDIQFAATEGSDLNEALTEAQDCLEAAIMSCIDDKEEIPQPSEPEGDEYPIRLSAQTAAKTALYIAMTKTRMTKSELAKDMGIDEKEVRRMMNPRVFTKLPRLEKALSVLGYHLSVAMEIAA